VPCIQDTAKETPWQGGAYPRKEKQRDQKEEDEMLKLYTWLMDLIRREEGQDVIEYALISALISVAIVITVLATGLVDAFDDWATYVATEMTAPFAP
jgi:Flp pilus assembly pilin Flp